MSKCIDVPYLTVEAGEAIEKYRRVKISAAGSTSDPPTVVKTGAGEEGIGSMRAAVASGGIGTVILDQKDGTVPVVASAAISALAKVYPAADGKVTSTPTGKAVGRVFDASTADGDVLECLVQTGDQNVDFANAFRLFDDFFAFIAASANEDLWTNTLTDSGTVTISDAIGGMLVIAASDGTIADNDEAYVGTTNELFIVTNGKPIFFETKVKLAAADTDGANVIAGLINTKAANTLLDNGGGPPASYDGIVFYKVDGGSAWAAEISVAGTQTAVTLTSPGAPGTSYQKLAFEVTPTSSTSATVKFYVDGVLVGTQAFTYTGMTEMSAVVGVKNGGGTVNTTLHVDYIHAAQVR